MLSIPAGKYSVWPDFSLELSSPHSFDPSFHYYLHGNNGSGKSSFIKKILLPALSHIPDIYHMYWEQQIVLQSYAIKAHAAFAKYEKKLDTDADCLGYLLTNLRQSLLAEKRVAYFVVDECLQLSQILSYIDTHQLPVCLIYTHHDAFPGIDKLHTITFYAKDSHLGVVSECKL